MQVVLTAEEKHVAFSVRLCGKGLHLIEGNDGHAVPQLAIAEQGCSCAVRVHNHLHIIIEGPLQADCVLF